MTLPSCGLHRRRPAAEAPASGSVQVFIAAARASASALELSDWGLYLGDAVIIRAILDRIVINAVRLRIDGPSYRQQVAEDRAKARADKRSKASKAKPSKAKPSKRTSKTR